MEPVAQLNDRTVLRLIASGQATCQRQIANRLRVPPNTAHCVVSRLRKRGLIAVERTESHGRGRPVQHYRLRARKPVLVIQWLGSVWNAAVCSGHKLRGAVLHRASPPLHSFEEAVAAVREVRDLALGAAGLTPDRIAGIALSINAVAAGRKGVLTSSVLPWMRGVSGGQFARALGGRLQLVPAVDTVLPELRARAANGVRSLAVLNVGDGVSAHGQSVDRISGVHCAFPGEIGHVVVEPEGAVCGCGNRGCLEAVISGPAMLRRIQRDVRRGTKTGLAGFVRKPPSELFTALEQLEAAGNDRYAARLADDYLGRVAWAVGVLMNMMGPEVIVLSGYGLQGREAWRKRIGERARGGTLFGASAGIRLEFPLLDTADHLRELANLFAIQSREGM